MSWLETAAIVGDTLGADALGASALGVSALTESLMPSVIGELGTDAVFNAAGTGANSAMAANTVSGGIGAGAGVQPTSSLAGSGLTMPGSVGSAGIGSTSYLPDANALGTGASSPSYLQSVMGSGNPYAIGASGASAGLGGSAALGSAEAAAPSGIMGYFNSALDWMKDNKITTAIGAGVLGSKLGLFNGKGSPAVDTTYRGILNDYKFNPDTFKPGGNANPTAITPPAYANYKNKPYASGGIAMSMGGQPGQMYPQSQQDRTTFTPPPTLPNSMNNMMAGYDTPTDPMTGDISQRLASGGVAGYASGTLAQTNGHHTDSLMQELNQYANMATNPDPFNTGYGAAQPAQSMMGQGIVGNDDPDLRGKNPYQRAQIMNAKLASVANMQGQIAATPNTPTLGGLNMAPQQQPQPQPQTAAGGGIMNAYASGGVSGGFNLGGYSDGGRLLKGPGDGMSDNIPATIAHKQPARLADGEFVVPADVVSHLGNGSTDAGAKRLYSMMDKVRHARTGSEKQGKEINADKFLPT